MDNQQERSLSWFAGILDGEGTISFQVYTKPDGSVRITPYVCVVNSDEGILNESFRILSELTADAPYAKPRWCNHRGRSETSFQSRKVCKNIRLDGRAVRYVLDRVLPYLRSSKRASAEAVLAYLDIRERRLFVRGKGGRIGRQGYTTSEVALVASIRSHSNAKSSEAICQAPNVTLG